MGSTAIVPASLPQIVLLPASDADLIDGVLAEALLAETRQQGPAQNRSEEAEEREKQKHSNAVTILVDATALSEGHLWHFLDSLGKYVSQSTDASTCLRGLLLLHGYLRSCPKERFRESVRMLLKPNGTSSNDVNPTSAKPELDLLSMSVNFHVSIAHQQQVAPEISSGVATAVKAYAKFLLQRLASSRFVFFPSGRAQCLGVQGSKPGGQVSVEPGLGSQYWTQQDPHGLMRQLQALQRLQEGVISCGTACGRWLQIAQQASVPVSRAATAAGAPAATVPAPIPSVQGASQVMAVALECLLQDSFLLFSSINYGLMELIERIGDISKEEGLQGLQVCRVSADQGKALSELYVLLGSLDVGRGVSFPSVAVMGDSYISSLAQCVGDNATTHTPGTPRVSRQDSVLLFSPAGQPQAEPAQTQDAQPPPAQPTYVQLAAAQQFEATTQALFGRYAPPPQPLHSSPAAGGAAPQNQLVLYQQRAPWELALDQALAGQQGNSAPSPVGAAPAQTQPKEGYNQAVALSLYEAAQIQHRASVFSSQQQQQRMTTVMHPQGAATTSAGQVAHFRGQKVDPFAASAAVAPPPYVQMSLRAQQQLANELHKKMMAKHAQFSANVASDWNTNGHGVRYGNVMVPF